jgi:type IX secretion system PorP/SprF family membrane protein
LWLLLVTVLCVGNLSAQQDLHLVQYDFQRLVVNPGFAGSANHLAAAATFRSQHVRLESAPQSLAMNIHTPLRGKRISLGTHLTADYWGPTRVVSWHGVYAYQLELSRSWQANLGVQVGFANWQSDWSQLNLQNPGDLAFSDLAINQWLPQVGFGGVLKGPHLQVGLSIPQLLENNIGPQDLPGYYVRRLRQIHLFLGGAWFATSDLELKPMVWWRYTPGSQRLDLQDELLQYGSPDVLDLALNAEWKESILIGLFARSSWTGLAPWASLGGWFGMQFDSGLQWAVSYDIPLNRLVTESVGSFELTVGYEWDVRIRKVVTPRFFR